MRLLLLTPVPFWHPGTPEMVRRLKDCGITTEALDIWSLNACTSEGRVHSLLPSWIGGLFRKVLVKLFRRSFLIKTIRRNDVIDVHWCGHYYHDYMEDISKAQKPIVATLFGSDLFRSTEQERILQNKIFQYASEVVMGVNMLDEFKRHSAAYADKVSFNQYGSKYLDEILLTKKKKSKEACKRELGIDPAKTVVTIGYNGKREQQHLVMLNGISELPATLLETLHFIVPCTYGLSDSDGYHAEIEAALKQLPSSYRVYCDKLSDADLTATKLASDITINLQTTDALSSSIKEAFVADNILIVGDWLPYDVYQDMGVYFERVKSEDLSIVFLAVLNNMALYHERCSGNAQKIASFASWDAVMPVFCNTYMKVYHEGRR